MHKLFPWVFTLTSMFLIYATLVWQSVVALTLLKASTIVGLILLSIIWPLLIFLLVVHYDKTIEQLHKSCTWDNQILTTLSMVCNVATVYLFAAAGSPFFTVAAILGTGAAAFSWLVRIQLGKERVKRLQRKKDIEETADRLVAAMKSRHVDADQLFRQ